jgi:hypothetical protein
MRNSSLKHVACVLAVAVSVGLILAVTSAGRAKADESLDQLISTALESHPDIVAAKAKVALAEAELNAARLQVARQMIALWSEKKSQEAAMNGLQAQINNTNDAMKRTELSRNLDDARSKMEMTNTMLKFLMAKPTAPVPVQNSTFPVLNNMWAHMSPAPAAKEILYPPKSVLEKTAKECFSQIIDVRFDDTPLIAVIEYLANITKYPFFLDKKALSQFGIEVDMPISMNIHKSPVPAILQAFEDQNQEMEFVIRDYGILLTTPEQAKEQGYYPARELTRVGKSDERGNARGQHAQTQETLQTLKNTISIYQLDIGEIPKDQQWPSALLTNPGVKDWKGPYLNQKISLTDEWGTPIRYEARQDNYSLSSAGPDKQFGTPDDILIQTGRALAPATR